MNSGRTQNDESGGAMEIRLPRTLLAHL
ncbi:MAG: hypothetical protein H6Q06_2725, partial [Acidobacteria bacterium]|nr:hypothetical protein [Acidobacteriota bacterium]